MELSSTTASASLAPAVATRLVPPPGPPAAPPTPPSGPSPAASQVGGTVGPQFDLAALTSSPLAPLPAGGATPPGAVTPTVSPAPALPLPTLISPATFAGVAGPPDVATLSRATALYTQTQQLVGTPPPPLPSPIEQAQPSVLTTTPPTTTETAAPSSTGAIGISTLGGAVQSPGQALSFDRGSVVNVLV